MKSFSQIIFVILFNFILSKNYYKEPETNDPGALKWGKAHSLNISSKIRFIKDKGTKRYMAKNLITEGKIILDIPPD